MLPFLGSLFVGLVLLRHLGDIETNASTVLLAGPTGDRGMVTERARRLLDRSHPATDDAPTTTGEGEKELLEALQRHGELTVAGVALETSLTVEEADRMLSALAVKGHLDVRVEYGRILYSLWRSEVQGVRD